MVDVELLIDIVGTFSMYTVLYGIFSYVAPRMDEYYRRQRGLRRFSLGKYAGPNFCTGL